MKRNLVLVIISILVLSTFATAQFRIKIPKIKKPKLPKVSENAAKSSSASKGKTRQMVLDDGFTFFDAEVIDELDTRVHKKVDKGWTIKPHLRLFGKFPRRSGFNVVVSKAGKRLLKVRCEAQQYPQKHSKADVNGTQYGDRYIWVGGRPGSECFKKKRTTKATGKLDVAVYYFNGETDEETLVREYKIDVRKATRVRGSLKKVFQTVPHYYIQRHAEVPASILFLSADDFYNYHQKSNVGFPDQVLISFNYSRKSWNEGYMPKGNVRCFVNGKFMRFPGEDRINPELIREETATYMDRLAPQYKRGNEYKDSIIFSQVTIPLPISWGFPARKRQVKRLRMQDHPGEWKCDYKYDGETIRTFRWTVGQDGKPIPHAEQKNGNINLAHNGFLIKTEIPEGGSEFDHRLAPMPNAGFFYGLPWTSAEGKAMAESVPRKGNLYHVPSNRAK